MKKSLIALAVIAASGAAMAQSSVTLYGIVDSYVGQTSSKTDSSIPANVKAKLSQTVVNGSGLSSSRWGLKGKEDLGGGLAAVFTLESGFSIDSGANANNGGTAGDNATNILFGRQASVGLSGGFGEVRLGRLYTAYDSLRAATNNTWDSNTFATTSNLWNKTGIADYSNRINNAISYVSPDFGGVSGAIVYGMGEDKKAATATTPEVAASNGVSLHIKYANGPLVVGYAFQREKENAAGASLFNYAPVATTATGATKADTRKYNLVAASYDFGVAKLVGGYNEAKNDTLKDKEYQLGVSVPFGAAAVAVGYTHSKSTSQTAVAATNKGDGFSLAGTYELSKRTTLYAGLTSVKYETANHTTTTKATVVGTGLRHAF